MSDKIHMGPKHPKIYEAYDEDGHLVARGQVGEVAQELNASPQTVWKAANGYVKRIWWKYTVKEARKDAKRD